MNDTGQYLDDLAKRKSDIVFAQIQERNDDGTYMCVLITTKAVVRAARSNLNEEYAIGSWVLLGSPSAGRNVVGAMYMILSRAPAEQRGLSETTPDTSEEEIPSAAVLNVVPDPLILERGGDSGVLTIYGHGFRTPAVFADEHIANDVDPVVTAEVVTMTLIADADADLGLKDGAIDNQPLTGVVKVIELATPPTPGDYLMFLAREVVGDHTEPRIVVVDSISLAHIITIVPDPSETELIDLHVVRNSSGVDETAHEWIMVRGATSLYAIRATDLVVFASFTGLPHISAPQTLYASFDFPGQSVPGSSAYHIGDAALVGSSQVAGEFGTFTWPDMAGAGPYGVAANYDPGGTDGEGFHVDGAPLFGVDGGMLYQLKQDLSANASTLAIAGAQVVTMSRGYAWVGAGNFVHKIVPFFWFATDPLTEIVLSADLGAAFDGTQLRAFPERPAWDAAQIVFGCVGSGGGAESKVVKFDDATLAVTSVAIPQGPHGLTYTEHVFTPPKLFVCDNDGGITIIDPETMTIETRSVCWPSAITRVCYLRRGAI